LEGVRFGETRGLTACFTDPLSRRPTSAYDAAGRQTLRIDARGYRTTYAFDANSQLVTRKYPDASRVTFAYDAVGSRTKMHDSLGRYTTTFDALDRPATTVNPASKRLTYSYDGVGNRVSMRDPDGGRFTYQYDAVNQITLLLNPQADRNTFAYDVAGRRTVSRLGNGSRASVTYDNADQITLLSNLKSDQTVISSFDYKYDPVGNRSRLVESNGDRVTWSYDATYQLTAEHRSGANAYAATYAYDAVGNRTLKNQNTARTTSTYDAADQLKTAIDNSGTTTYTFDAEGNQQKVREPSGNLTTYAWDYENRNSRVQLPSAQIVTMAYQPDGLRVTKATATDTTKFVWDRDNYLVETDGSDATLAVYTSDPQQFGNLVSQRRGSTSSFFHFEALGSTRNLTASNGATSDTFLFDAFGNLVTSSGSTVNPFRFVGQLGYYYDSETINTYVRARHYRPQLGLWLAVDPLPGLLALASGPGGDVNLYRYVGNSPTGFVDPSGLSCCVCDFRLYGTHDAKGIRELDAEFTPGDRPVETAVRAFYQATLLPQFTKYSLRYAHPGSTWPSRVGHAWLDWNTAKVGTRGPGEIVAAAYLFVLIVSVCEDPPGSCGVTIVEDIAEHFHYPQGASGKPRDSWTIRYLTVDLKGPYRKGDPVSNNCMISQWNVPPRGCPEGAQGIVVADIPSTLSRPGKAPTDYVWSRLIQATISLSDRSGASPVWSGSYRFRLEVDQATLAKVADSPVALPKFTWNSEITGQDSYTCK
jgi:RHS repeat-associated protein